MYVRMYVATDRWSYVATYRTYVVLHDRQASQQSDTEL